MKTNIAVLSDFDGTITRVNLLELLYARFGAPSYREIVDRWEKGEISTQQEIESCFATTTAGQAEMEAALTDIPLDPGFPALLELCRERAEFAIVSDGFRWYIEYILSRIGVGDLKIYANEITFLEKGYRFSFPWYDARTPLRGVSKPAIIQGYQARGFHVVFIGDGHSDYEAAHVADLVFARDSLIEYTRRTGIDVIPYDNLDSVTAELRERFYIR